MRTVRAYRRHRRIGLAILLLGLLPLLTFGAATAIARLSGGGVGNPRHDVRTYGLYAESLGFAETTPSSTVSVKLIVHRRAAFSPRVSWLPWWVRRDLELRAELERGDTKITRALTDAETSAMLRHHAPRVTAALSGMFQGMHPDITTLIGEMARAGQTRRTLAEVLWRNIPVDLAGWLGGWWRLGLWTLMIGTGAVVWWRHRPIPPGHCLWCRYDLRGISAGSPCPECGNVPEEVASPAASH